MSFIEEAKNELKRADHQIFVSLKYTRTADVLRNIIKRFVACFDNVIEVLLLKKEQAQEIESIPPSPIARVNLIKRIYDDDILKDFFENYILFRKILNSSFHAINEYRRHVALILDDDEDIKINIDNISEYYTVMKEFFNYVTENYDLNIEE